MSVPSRCIIAFLCVGVLAAFGWRWSTRYGLCEDPGNLEQFQPRVPALTGTSLIRSILSAHVEEKGGDGAVLRFENQPMALSEWVAAGYFNAADDSEALATDYIGLCGGAVECGFTLEQTLAAPHMYPQLRVTRRIRMSENINPFAVFSINRTSGIAPTFYLEAKVHSDRSRDAILLLGSDGLVKAWLNGRDIGVPAKRRELLAETYNTQVRLELAEGINRLLFKVARAEKSCGIVATLVPDSHQAVQTLFEKNRSFLQSLILSEGMPLAVELRGAPEGTALDISISSHDQTKITSFSTEDGTIKWQVPHSMPAGVYYASASFEDLARTEAFVVGDPAAIIRDAMNTLEKECEQRDAINVRAIGRRASILLDASNRKPGDREWQRKIVYTIEELEDSVSRLRKQQPLWKNLPGLHLRGFRSRLDGAERHYRIFIPRKYNARQAIPLAIMAPTALSASRPFIESAFIASHLDAECLAEVAEELGIGILWPGYPALPFGNPCEFSHFDDVLEAVAADYAIDTKRVFILGTCHGATIATMMAQNWPKRFAALGLLNPTVSRKRNSARDEQKYQRFSAYGEWISANDPINHLKDIPNTPIHVVFDNGDPEHGSLVEAEGFVTSARAANLAPTFEQVASSLSRIHGWKRLLAQVSLDNRNDASIQISERRTRLAQHTGPIARGFSPEFIVVQGTVGTESERAANARIVKQFADSWREVFYAECPIKLDVDVEETAIRNRNIVLIGNSHTNSVWKSLDQHFAVRIESGGIAVAGKQYEGNGLAIQAIVRSPLHADRRCVIIGAHDLANAQFGTMDLAIDGWFDYAVWQAKDDGRPRLLVAERYSHR